MEAKNYERVNNLLLRKFFALVLFPLLSTVLFGFAKGSCDYYLDGDFEIKQLLIWLIVYYFIVFTFFLILWIFVIRKLSRIILTLSSEYIALKSYEETIIPWDEVDKIFIQTSKIPGQILNIRVDSKKRKSILFGGFDEIDEIERFVLGKIAGVQTKRVEIILWHRVILEQLPPLFLFILAVSIYRENSFLGNNLTALSCFIWGAWFIKFNPYRSSLIVPKQIGWFFSTLFFVLGFLFLILIVIDKYFI